MSARAHARRALWLLLAAPGLAQLGLLLYTVARRFAYPFDLEWMEGGMLAHAARLTEGQSIYPPPSIDFIPYLYTPLYPTLLALLGSVFGISYQLGRAISVAAILAVVALLAVALRRIARQAGPHAPALRPAAWCGAAVATGFFCATYPWVEGWYDIARADTLFLAMLLGGLLLLERQARARAGLRGHLAVAGAAAVLALSFFCKQTGVFYVAVGGALLLAWSWRRVPAYVLAAGTVGLGGTALLTSVTDGWFWTYAYEVHQAHDFNMDRFYASFGNILGRSPGMSAAVLLGLVAVAVTGIGRRALPAGAGPFLRWTLVFGMSCVVGAIGWGTQWAHFNAYMPAMLTGGLAAGAALPALAGCARAWRPDRAWLALAAPAVVAGMLAVQLAAALWSPAPFVPAERDRAAGHALIEHLRGMRAGGDIYVPYHPWYARMAGQASIHAHRMGIMDMSYGNHWQVAGLREAFREHRFAAVILDDRPPGWEFPGLRQHYRPDDRIPGAMRPRTFTGARVVPDTVWVPIDTGPPPGATVLFDFEQAHVRGWDMEGPAWGRRPVAAPVRGQGPVPGYRGRYYLTSMHRGDRSTGTLTSPVFRVTGERLTFRMSGGADPDALRIELRLVAGNGDAGSGQEVDAPSGMTGPVRTASNDIDSERMREVVWDVGELAGREARLVLVDQATGAWGHLNADDFLLWPE